MTNTTPQEGRMDILKTSAGLVQLHACPKCNYLVRWTDTVNEAHLCKWCDGHVSTKPEGWELDLLNKIAEKVGLPAGADLEGILDLL